MKLRLRFILFFIGGFISFIVFMGLFVMACSEYLIPQLTVDTAISNLLNISAILITFLIGGVMFGLFFVNPLVYMISLIRNLSLENTTLLDITDRVFTDKGKLKARYFLYRELIDDIGILAKQLKTAQTERERLEAAKTNWIAGVSHDLKTPLSYITGYSSLLLDNKDAWQETEARKYLREIHDKSVVIADLIGDLNISFKMDAVSEVYPLKKETFDAVDFLQRLLADIASSPNATQYGFSFHSSADVIAIHADEKLLYRAMQNVVINAVTHNPPGTEIDLTINSDTANRQVSIVIADNGIGISEETVKKLFHRYYQSTENENKSGGLGLSVAKSMIEAHGGKIAATSKPGLGTAFEITLPT